jgi:hypothetical protein
VCASSRGAVQHYGFRRVGVRRFAAGFDLSWRHDGRYFRGRDNTGATKQVGAHDRGDAGNVSFADLEDPPYSLVFGELQLAIDPASVARIVDPEDLDRHQTDASLKVV